MNIRTRLRRLSAQTSPPAVPTVRRGFDGSPIRWEGETITEEEYHARLDAGAQPRIIYDWPQQTP